MVKKSSLMDKYMEKHGGGNNSSNLDIDSLNHKDVTTFHDGRVATVMTWKHDGKRVITQYDENGHVTVSQELGEKDVVNFNDGFISSIIKYTGKWLLDKTERVETQYGENGRMLSSTNQTKIGQGNPGADKWITTQHTTYYGNGRLATVTTYQQRTKRKTREVGDEWSWIAQADELIFGGGEDIAESFVSSITQYDESGKLLVTFQFHEFDEVSYHPSGRVAHILRKDENNNPTSMTAYDENGKILNVMVYQNGKVISTTDYTNGHPTNNVQLGDEQYQNIFDSAKERVEKKSADKEKQKTFSIASAKKERAA